MKRLLHTENVGGRLERWWLHSGEGPKHNAITVETIQDVEPVFDAVARKRNLPKGKDFRYVAHVSGVVIEEVCKIKAALWGVRHADAFREIMNNKTDRAQQVWAELLRGRDYRKFQAGG